MRPSRVYFPHRLQRKALRRVERERRAKLAELRAEQEEAAAKAAEFEKWKAIQKSLGLWKGPFEPEGTAHAQGSDMSVVTGDSLRSPSVAGLEGDGDAAAKPAVDPLLLLEDEEPEDPFAAPKPVSLVGIMFNNMKKRFEDYMRGPVVAIPFHADLDHRLVDEKRWWDVRTVSDDLTAIHSSCGRYSHVEHAAGHLCGFS